MSAEIALLPTAKITPRSLLHLVLNDEADDLDQIVVVRCFKDGTALADWSDMRAADLTFLAAKLQIAVHQFLNGEIPEAVRPDHAS